MIIMLAVNRLSWLMAMALITQTKTTTKGRYLARSISPLLFRVKRFILTATPSVFE